jgi:DNA polymerase-3 subunit gamma/tau
MVVRMSDRSASFAEVVGQDHIVKTLTSALANHRLSHAYLFTGPRGTGKTSVARLLARALNCTGETKPCNQCPNCQTALNSSLDVVEIDAASNRSIDSVRDLKDKIALAPTTGQYKIYIIDEVHMLTTEAFNALLKTLEEPPPHAVFIMATTEAHKLPDTIISRTQRFTFKPIALSDLVTHLGKIAASENIAIEPAALESLGTAARGSFRDAISLLDQLHSGASTPITAATVRELLGLTDAGQITAVSRALAAHDARGALQTLQQLTAAGAQPAQVATQLLEQWRSILLSSTGAQAPSDPDIKELTATTSPTRAAAVIEGLLEVMRSHWPGLSLEAAVVKLAATPEREPAPAPAASAKAVAKTTPTAKSAPAPAAPNAPEPAAPTASDASSALDPALWPKVVVLIKQQNNSLGALLQMYPIDIVAGEIKIKPRFNFHRDLFMKPANIRIIETAAAKVYRRPVKVSARTDNPDPGKRGPKPDPSAELISSALEILGGEVVE